MHPPPLETLAQLRPPAPATSQYTMTVHDAAATAIFATMARCAGLGYTEDTRRTAHRRRLQTGTPSLARVQEQQSGRWESETNQQKVRHRCAVAWALRLRPRLA